MMSKLIMQLNNSEMSQETRVRDHEGREKKAAESWESIRPGLLNHLIESCSHPINARCTFCSLPAALVYCQDCSAYLCMECAQKLHTNINLFHDLVLWKEDTYIPFQLPISTLLMKDHQCETAYFRDLTCIGGLGSQRKVRFQFCRCFSEAETLIKLGYFAATPKRPQIAFQFHLLDLLEALLLECQVAVKDFTNALNCLVRCPLHIIMKTHADFYKVLLNAFEEYRYLKTQIRYLRIVCEGLTDGTACPACPKNGGVIILAIDGHFGLCRKKAAGKSVRPPLHNGVYFEDQTAVDAFVSGYSAGPAKKSKECSEFLAGDLVRSKSRYKALDETGVIGIACRHEFPYRLYNLKHGERISYIVYALEMIKKRSEQHPKVLLLYDIACLLLKHLKGKNREDLMNFFEFAIPVFHSYGHKMECQLSMSPRYMEGFALSDGEVCERLWSFMRRFSRMTKEMRPSHRVDVLTDALLHFSRLTIANLRTLLCMRLKRAEKVKLESEEKLLEFNSELQVAIEESTISSWLESEQSACKHGQEPTDERAQLLEKLGAIARDRWFMLTIKAKFAEGHNMASRLSRSITTETKKLKDILREFNSVVTPEEQLSWEEVTNLTSSVWLPPLPASDPVPRSVRISMINALMKKQRAVEEKSLIITEMSNVLQYFLGQHSLILGAISSLESTSNSFNCGAICLLRIKQYQYEQDIRDCVKLFPSSVEIPGNIPFPLEETASAEVFSTDVPLLNIEMENDDTQSIDREDNSESDTDNDALDCLSPQQPIDNYNPECSAPKSSHQQIPTVEFAPLKNQGSKSTAYTSSTIKTSSMKTTEKNYGCKKQGTIYRPYQSMRRGSELPAKLGQKSLGTEPRRGGDHSTRTEVGQDYKINNQEASTKQPSTRSDSSSDSESDEDEFALAWQQTKERLEREEFLKDIRNMEYKNILSKEDEAILSDISFGPAEEKQPSKKTLFLHRSQEELDKLLSLSKKDIQNAKFKGPFFHKT